MRFYTACMLSIGLTLLFVGCRGTGDTVNFAPEMLEATPETADMSHDDTLRISVVPFDDVRTERDTLGERTHFWGGKTHFNAWDGDVGPGIADLAIEYLQQHKWQARKDADDALSDVVLSGKVLQFDANAKSGFGFTDIDVKLKLALTATNTVDGSTVRMTRGSHKEDRVVFFDSSEVKHVTDEVVRQLFDELFRDLTVKDRAFQLRSRS